MRSWVFFDALNYVHPELRAGILGTEITWPYLSKLSCAKKLIPQLYNLV